MCLYNYVNMPCGIVPVTSVTGQDQAQLEESYPRDTSLTRLVRQTLRGSVGMPLCVQIVGLPWQEELVLHGMQQLEAAARYGDC